MNDETLASRNERFAPEPAIGTPADHSERIRASKYLPELPTEVVERHLAADNYQLPPTRYRQQYHQDRHHDYWRSGAWDCFQVMKQWQRFRADRSLKTYFDFGGSSGRVARHFAALYPECSVYLSDLFITPIEWALANLASNTIAFQGTTQPSLPLADQSIELTTAFSVFTHIDRHEYGWLAELRRVTRKDGLLYVTLMTEEVWNDFMEIDWRYATFSNSVEEFSSYPRGTAMPYDRMPFYNKSGSYTATFHKTAHVHRVWSRFFDVLDILQPRIKGHDQTVIVMQPNG